MSKGMPTVPGTDDVKRPLEVLSDSFSRKRLSGSRRPMKCRNLKKSGFREKYRVFTGELPFPVMTAKIM
jgi:hypothetical protein